MSGVLIPSVEQARKNEQAYLRPMAPRARLVSGYYNVSLTPRLARLAARRNPPPERTPPRWSTRTLR